MRIFTYIILLILVLLGISFAGLNAGPVALNYYVGNLKLPLSLLLATSLVIGGMLGLLACLFLTIKYKSANHRLKQRLKMVEQEVANLRAIPIKNDR